MCGGYTLVGHILSPFASLSVTAVLRYSATRQVNLSKDNAKSSESEMRYDGAPHYVCKGKNFEIHA